jgi:hypothetical protein
MALRSLFPVVVTSELAALRDFYAPHFDFQPSTCC